MVEYGCKIEEKVKAMKSDIKENAQGTNSDRKELGLKSMIWNRREKQEPPKNEERLWNLGATLSVPTSES